jgi:hypothetical protein
VFDELAEPDDVVHRALETARDISAFSAAIYARTKLELRGSTLEALRTAVEAEPLLTEDWLADASYRDRARENLGLASR